MASSTMGCPTAWPPVTVPGSTVCSQNEENRSNLALVNTGEDDDGEITLEIDIYDGEGDSEPRTVERVVGVRSWLQLNGILGGRSQGYVEVRKTGGDNPFITYGVINDGRQAVVRRSGRRGLPAQPVAASRFSGYLFRNSHFGRKLIADDLVMDQISGMARSDAPGWDMTGLRVVGLDQVGRDAGPADAFPGQGDGGGIDVGFAGVDVGGVAEAQLDIDGGEQPDEFGNLEVAHEPPEIVGSLHVEIQRQGDCLPDGGQLAAGAGRRRR